MSRHGGHWCGCQHPSLHTRIADRGVRSDIETFAYSMRDDAGICFDTSRPAEEQVDRPGGAARCMDVVSDALLYIGLRGDVFPWRLVRSIDAPHIVRFIDKE